MRAVPVYFLTLISMVSFHLYLERTYSDFRIKLSFHQWKNTPLPPVSIDTTYHGRPEEVVENLRAPHRVEVRSNWIPLAPTAEAVEAEFRMRGWEGSVRRGSVRGNECVNLR